MIATSFVETDILVPHPRWAEQWPDVWLNAFIESIREVLKISEIDQSNVGGLSVSGLFSAQAYPLIKNSDQLDLQ